MNNYEGIRFVIKISLALLAFFPSFSNHPLDDLSLSLVASSA